jgi:predicted phosphodiesterase
MKPLGEIKGKIIVFGGVYSNFQALESLKAYAEHAKIPPHNIFCTGDVAGYCAQPEECVQLVKSWGINCIAGNVELQLASGEDDCGCDFDEGSRCDVFSRQWYPYAQSKLSTDSIQWMKSLPEHLTFNHHGKKVVMVHGSYSGISDFIFKSTPWEEKLKHFEATRADIILAGHCGLPFKDEQGGFQWLNAGVIGMPANDGETAVWFMEMNEDQTVAHHQLKYDHTTANQLMIENNLPEAYAKTLVSGIWDNCEILPESETNQQGKSIAF